MISVTVTGDPKKWAERGPLIIANLTRKMTALMLLLQAKIVGESIPAFFPSGAPNIASTIRANPVQNTGSKIVGDVTGGVTSGSAATRRITLGGPNAGAVVDYAAVQEFGGKAAFTIQPALKKALAFELGGKQIIAKSVFHPPLEARPYMRSELQNMESQIVAELEKAMLE